MQEGLIRKRGKTIRTSPKRKKAIWKKLKKNKTKKNNVTNKVVKVRDRGGRERERDGKAEKEKTRENKRGIYKNLTSHIGPAVSDLTGSSGGL